MNTSQFQKKLLGMQENMMNFALMLTANREDAQDLLQETSLKVLDNREKYVDNRNFKGWVLTVMRNIFINNYHRVLRTQTVVEQDVDLYNLHVTNDSSFDTPDGTCQLQEITGAIDALNEELKAPFSMYVSGYRYHEIAEALHIPLGTVKSRIFFARQELKTKLRDFNP
ncbi:RNA polymerase sigma factor [Tannerella forsythia]|uniref:RNA polymerase sigma factor n=1 Tax=Tannerella forsythia TaxID=28112 RepID=UPI000BE7471B|nr:RNA polymerase sigma factor [Tannerella forsythia]PDP69876.1 RNA polymerase subunit sigma [Tannerella forsythia]